MIYFDPSEIMRGIRQLLISDKKRIGFSRLHDLLKGAVANGDSAMAPFLYQSRLYVSQGLLCVAWRT